MLATEDLLKKCEHFNMYTWCANYKIQPELKTEWAALFCFQIWSIDILNSKSSIFRNVQHMCIPSAMYMKSTLFHCGLHIYIHLATLKFLICGFHMCRLRDMHWGWTQYKNQIRNHNIKSGLCQYLIECIPITGAQRKNVSEIATDEN